MIASSACLSQGKNTSREIINAPAAQQQADAERLPVSPPTRFENVELFNRSHWLVAESNRLLDTSDGGVTWTQIFSTEAGSKGVNDIHGLSFIDERVGFLIVGGRLLFTDNSGTNWADVGPIHSGDKRVSFGGCYFIDAIHGWAVGRVWQEGAINNSTTSRYEGIAFATQDGGRTWQRQSLDAPNAYLTDGTSWSLNSVLFKDANTGWIAGDRGTIFQTTDGGGKWNLVTAENVDYQSINFLDKRFGWVTYKYGNSSWGVATTTDGGRHWKLLNESFVYGTWPVFAVFVTPAEGFAISLRLYETTDKGHQWKWRSGGNEVGEAAYEYMGQAKNGTLVALGTKNGTATALISTDDGREWQPSK